LLNTNLNPLVDDDGQIGLVAAVLAGEDDEQRETAERLHVHVGEFDHWT
ncbi:MAG: hypothetical protein GWN79_27210, partial [Actinobacteria bacterium]|nr:hypothetical protein [Actinomycetota bacterium]NIS36709.1 hypothetical protein [Actinomycetota bacterium]NIT98869.1 hypothetical protein [Actinomycetota bacterium]NIU22500.1 hypothetical protein [Actinomycetota bacterium]NIU71198.1 hypothetical protein [Actinomycetota bacterium]